MAEVVGEALDTDSILVVCVGAERIDEDLLDLVGLDVCASEGLREDDDAVEGARRPEPLGEPKARSRIRCRPRRGGRR